MKLLHHKRSTMLRRGTPGTKRLDVLMRTIPNVSFETIAVDVSCHFTHDSIPDYFGGDAGTGDREDTCIRVDDSHGDEMLPCLKERREQ